MLSSDGRRLVFAYDSHTLWIEPWGHDALRIRATELACMPTDDWALLPNTEDSACSIDLNAEGGSAEISNGKIRATVSRSGTICMYNSKGEKILEEYARNRLDLMARKTSALEIKAREFRPKLGGDYHLTMRLESISRDERLYGMGQYQQDVLDLKGSDLELAHRNSQASVPFVFSSLGYGLLWNNPGIGRAVFGRNVTTFEAYSTKILDYWIVAGDSPADIVQAYVRATGLPPVMPEYGLGFWQSKLRYSTQEELLNIAREYKRRDLPLDVIVVDFFHWKWQGDWHFDKAFFPDPPAMVAELQKLGVELQVSIWPTVERQSENYEEMLEKGLLIRSERGVRVALQCGGDSIHCDVTNPEARKFLWAKAKQHYHDLGIKAFWLDVAEPEYQAYDFDNYRYHLGSNLQIGNVYPAMYAKTFFDGQRDAGQQEVVSLIRCAWAGSQRYGALVWSGDTASSWESFRNQLCAGLSMSMAGILWWTNDIGGFHGGKTKDPKFRELLIRWFQWATFLPVMRLHGDREPKPAGQPTSSGADNEVWSFGDEAYPILVQHLRMREFLRPYTRSLFLEAHEKGSPIMRPLFYEFPDDPVAWNIESQFMFGGKYLVAPVMTPQTDRLAVYLPKGAKWTKVAGEKLEADANFTKLEGGQTVQVPCPLNCMPVFVRA